MGILSEHPALALGLIASVGAVAFSATRAGVALQWFSNMLIGAFFFGSGFDYMAILIWLLGTCQCLAILLFARRLRESSKVDRGGLLGALIVLSGAVFAAMTVPFEGIPRYEALTLAVLGERWGNEAGLALVLMGLGWVIGILGLGVISVRTGGGRSG